MSDSVELLLLRLALFAVVFGTAAAIARSLRSSYLPRRRPAAAQTSALPPWRLIVEVPAESGVPRGTAFRLAGVMEIGRQHPAAIVIADPSVSARHARLERIGESWRLADLGSTNGTFVDGRPVPPGGTTLAGGERIQLGAVVLRLASPADR
ncbi:MAG: hypothetical protein KatS3mg062_0438 [Tepidiforma sp.]|nr:MAG: hypothetical protein KatS3mg062_0438 [Tepidiforma sp.]